jgi:hypothetical protein
MEGRESPKSGPRKGPGLYGVALTNPLQGKHQLEGGV